MQYCEVSTIIGIIFQMKTRNSQRWDDLAWFTQLLSGWPPAEVVTGCEPESLNTVQIICTSPNLTCAHAVLRCAVVQEESVFLKIYLQVWPKIFGEGS